MNENFFIKGNEQGTFSGVDIKATLAVPMFSNTVGLPNIPPLINLSNISVVSWSTHRDKVPVRSIGKSYAQAYTHGPRTIAGSMVFINFNKAALWDIINHLVVQTEDSPVHSIMTDQVPPFNMYFMFVNEDGLSAFMSLYDIEIVDEGMVLGTDEAYLETTLQYVAKDIDLLHPGPNMKEAWDSAGSEIVTQEKYFATEREADDLIALVGNGTKVKLISTGSGERADTAPWQVTYDMSLSRGYMSGLGAEANNKRFVQMLNAAGFDQLNSFSQLNQPIVSYDSAGNPHLDRAAIHEQQLSMDPLNPDTTPPTELPVSMEEEGVIAPGQPGLTSGSTLEDIPVDTNTTEEVSNPASDTIFNVMYTITISDQEGVPLKDVKLTVVTPVSNEQIFNSPASGRIAVTGKPGSWSFTYYKDGYSKIPHSLNVDDNRSVSVFMTVST